MASVKMDKYFKNEKNKEDHGNYRAITDLPISLSHHVLKNYLLDVEPTNSVEFKA